MPRQRRGVLRRAERRLRTLFFSDGPRPCPKGNPYQEGCGCGPFYFLDAFFLPIGYSCPGKFTHAHHSRENFSAYDKILPFSRKTDSFFLAAKSASAVICRKEGFLSLLPEERKER
ncbi:MAG: hypothetical protein C6W57_11060 [Caldibacillus debilis]|nr:MAG: hypothetical protein C6W57_11060 [Caldibacillus debilis]